MEERKTRRPEQRVDDEVFSINSGVWEQGEVAMQG